MPITKADVTQIVKAIRGALDGLVAGEQSPDEGYPGWGRATPDPTGATLEGNGVKHVIQPPSVPSPQGTGAQVGNLTGDQFELLYRQVKSRLIDECRLDPTLVQLLTTAPPEIIVNIEPRRLEIDGTSLKGRIARLLSKDFFGAGKRHGEVRKVLDNTGAQVNGGNLSTALKDFVRDGLLVTEGEVYFAAPGLGSGLVSESGDSEGHGVC